MKRQVSCTVCFYPIISIPLFVHIFLSCFRFCSCNLHKNFVNLAANQNALPSMQTWNDAMQTMQLTSPKKEERMLQWKSHFSDYNFFFALGKFCSFFCWTVWLCNLQCLLYEIITATKQSDCVRVSQKSEAQSQHWHKEWPLDDNKTTNETLHRSGNTTNHMNCVYKYIAFSSFEAEKERDKYYIRNIYKNLKLIEVTKAGPNEMCVSALRYSILWRETKIWKL